MRPETVQRMCGISLALGGVLIAAYSIAFAVLFPRAALLADFAAAVVRPAWTVLGLTAFVAILLMMVGFGGVYARMSSRAGVLGLVGWLTIEIAYLLQAAKVTWELCVYPALAHGAGAAILDGRVLVRDPRVAAFHAVAMLTILAGVVLFTLAVVRSRALPRAGGVLVLAGALAYGLGPMLALALAHAGIVVLAFGCLVLARALLRDASA